jgi:hypothetical protein
MRRTLFFQIAGREGFAFDAAPLHWIESNSTAYRESEFK